MRRLLYILLLIIGGGLHIGVFAQTPRTAYHQEGFVFGHELNPAFQPEESYFSLPILGNTSVSMQSSLGLGDLFYDRKDGGGLTTFMSQGTISKSDLMDKVGSAYKGYVDGNLTLISFGRRVDSKRYQTLSVNLRGKSAIRVDDSMFNLLKDVKNKHYRVTDTRLDASVYAEIALGESRKLDEHWTVGAKAKLLVGINHLDMDVESLDVDLYQNEWIADGQVTMHVAGFDYTTDIKKYREEGRGQYESVSGLRYTGFVPRGIGLAIDLGASYKMDDNWMFSASVLDLGFMCWPDSKKAWNHGGAFGFDGIHNVCMDDPDKEYQIANPVKESLRDQMDRLGDDLMTVAHLEKVRAHAQTHVLGATIHAGARYKQNQWTAGALVTSFIRGNLSWFEGRISATYQPVERLDITLAPAYGTTGFSVGAMVNYQLVNGINLNLGSDALVTCFNRQMIPTPLSASLQFGMTFAIR